MAFKELLKQRRRSGEGIMSSIAGSAASNIRETADIRNYLFKSGSFLNALFPNVKGYKSVDKTPRLKTSPTSLSVGMDGMSGQKLDDINQNVKITAKNSVVLPKIAMDMNLVKLNIMKLVSAANKPVSRDPDMFFAGAKQRENMYEAQFGKRTTPTPTSTSPEKKDGFLSKIFESLSKDLFGTLIRGGLITGLLYLIGKYFTDNEFKDSVNTMTDNVLKGLFGDEYKQKLQNVIEDVISNVSLAFLGYIAIVKSVGFVMAGLKTGLIALELGLLKASASLGVAGLLGALGPIIALGGVAFGLYKLIKSDKKVTQTMEEAGNNWTPDMSSVTTAEPMTTDEMIGGIQSGGLAGQKDYEQLKKNSQNETQKFLRQQDEALKKQKGSPTPVSGSSGISLLNNVMDKEGITDPNVRNKIMNLAQLESSMNPNARGIVLQSGMHKGDQAHGLLQVMPKTAEQMGFSREDIKDPEKAATAGVRYFMKNYKDLGSLEGAIVAHHAGPGKAREFLRTGAISTTDLGTGMKTSDYLSSVMGSPKFSGSALASSSTQMNDGLRSNAFTPPVVNIASPQTTNVSGGSSGSSIIASPSVVDQDFMKYLAARAM